MAERKPYRLPNKIVPNRYKLRLTPDLDAAKFSGEETVFIDIHEPVQEIVLNAAELELESVSIQTAGGEPLAGAITLDSENEQATLGFAQTLAPGSWELRIG